MNSDKFMEAIKLYVRDSAISDTIDVLETPVGRRPKKEDIELSAWFNKLSEENKLMVERSITEAVDSALFGIFAVLDGVRVIEDYPNKGNFELYYVKGQERRLLNSSNEEELHDKFNTVTK